MAIQLIAALAPRVLIAPTSRVVFKVRSAHL
jgi:hypothetical protein